MDVKRRIMMASATLFVAFGAGYVVQQRSGSEDVAMPVDIVPLAASTEPEIRLPEPVPLELSAPILPAPTAPPVAAAPQPLVAPAPVMAEVQDCTPSLRLSVAAGAMIDLTLSAPCRPDARVVIRHDGLAVTARTSATGALQTSLPALAADAAVSVLFAGGETAESRIEVPGAAGFRRFAVQWMGADAFQIHAFEDGAGYGTPGHVSAADPRVPAPGSLPGNGFLTVLGDDQVDTPMLAEVYTFPAATHSVEVVLEAAVTPQTCGREILGETLMAKGGAVITSDLTLAVPACDALGGYLVLKNLSPDLTLASAD